MYRQNDTDACDREGRVMPKERYLLLSSFINQNLRGWYEAYADKKPLELFRLHVFDLGVHIDSSIFKLEGTRVMKYKYDYVS